MLIEQRIAVIGGTGGGFAVESKGTFVGLTSRASRRRVSKIVPLWILTAYLRFCCKRF